MARHRTRGVDPGGLGPDALGSVMDPITGLPDFRVFGVLVERKLALARRALQPVSLVLFEVDGFEQLGATPARVALRLAARLVRGTLRDSDSVCHCSGGIVAAILDDTPHSGAVWAADRVRREVAARSYHTGVTLSMGVASYPTHALEAPDLRDRAFAALYMARSLGPSRLEVAEPMPH
ncbi:GGDEF domain-containing protein [Candidatus Poriferisodalis sp.]|uniref:GGDEF domain-containing protein n=1 Tax=Candidatus Poriferisodalis sp. TaxID=3101277 RepID=UPI003B02C468